MTTFEPGRIYSGIVDGKRQIIFCDGEHWHHVDDYGNLCGGDRSNGNYTDVRGPLVVLDLPDLTARDWEICAFLIREQAATGCEDVAPIAKIADQIEEQTRPPLQVGWHEVRGPSGDECVLYWTGTEWRLPIGGKSAWQEWTSVYYIGPASGDSK